MEKMGIINRPQFDANIFTPGKGIHFICRSTPNGYETINADAIITDFNPLRLKVTYYSSTAHEMDDEEIRIGSVVEETCILTMLEEIKEGKIR